MPNRPARFTTADLRRPLTRRERPAEPMLRPFVGLAYRPEEAARMLGISKSTLWERVRDGRLPVKRDGGATVILHRDLEAYLDALPYDDRSRPGDP